ncbi:MAG: SDR family NAD(P)-dependent oxidoreductase [Candidatus Micrarchaeia archaeon]
MEPKDYEDSEVLITGGAGFIGSNLARRLVSLGAKVTILDGMLPGYGGNMKNLEGMEGDIEFIKADIRDMRRVEEAVKEKDYVFSLAAQVNYVDALKMALYDIDVNLKGHINILEACRKHAESAAILFTSSRMVYGITNGLTNEDAPKKPITLYGIEKLVGEMYYMIYARAYGMKTTIVRIANPYGPRQQIKHWKYGIVGWFMRLAMEDKTIEVFGDGKQLRDYVYVDDVVEGMVVACGNQGPFNIGSGKGTAFIDMAKSVVKVVGKGRIKHAEWPEDYGRDKTGDYIADIGRLKELGWRPETCFEEGLRKMYEYYRENFWFYI